MHEFRYSYGELFCEMVKVSEIADLNKTPFYLYSKKTIEDHYRKIDAAFREVPHTICYSLKANSNLAICRSLAALGAGADIVSGGELYKALLAGIPPSKIVYAGVGKTGEEIRYALEKDILMFNVESEGELELIDKAAGRLDKTAVCALRLNPDVAADTHDYITTGTSGNKFGMDERTAEKLFLDSGRFPNVDLSGLHIHIGSQMVDLDPYVESVRKAISFIAKLEMSDIGLRSLNIGGGLGISYKDEAPSTADEFASRVVPMLRETGLEIIMEPGRFIAGNGGILVSKVINVKETRNKTFIIVDAGMNDLFRPALYGAYHDIQPVKKTGGEKVLADVVGPICESGDFFAQKRLMPGMKPGDYIAVFSVGAYGYAMASNYNARPRVAEYLVDGETFKLIREPEHYVDLVDTELLRFTKMCGSGNDFIMIDNRNDRHPDRAGLARRLCGRSISAGADGVIFLERGMEEHVLRMRIFNSDGSEPEMCGNGARCFAAYAHRQGFVEGGNLVFETGAGTVSAAVIKDEEVRLKMSEPSGLKLGIKLNAGGGECVLNSINTGVPHAVIFTDDLEKADVAGLGREIREHDSFKPAGTNVNFVKVLSDKAIQVRTYERGVEAETLACGTGAAAAALISHVLGKVSPPVNVRTSGGELKLAFKPGKEPSEVHLQGDARVVYDGVMKIPGSLQEG